VEDSEAWLTVLGFENRETLLELSQAGRVIPLRRLPNTPFLFRIRNKEVEIRVGERVGNQVRVSIGGDKVEALREELLTGREASA
jgi:hypothetical protein